MKIGFTGSGGSGKTSVVTFLRGCYPTIPFLPSPARAIFAKWGITEEEQEHMSLEDKIALQNEIYEARFLQEIEYPNFMSDRTLLDNFAYHVFRCYQGITTAEYVEFHKRTVENLKSYDHIFYFPMLEIVEEDEFRYAAASYQTMIDSIIYAFLLKNNIKFHHVPHGTPEERATWMKGIIG